MWQVIKFVASLSWHWKYHFEKKFYDWASNVSSSSTTAINSDSDSDSNSNNRVTCDIWLKFELWVAMMTMSARVAQQAYTELTTKGQQLPPIPKNNPAMSLIQAIILLAVWADYFQMAYFTSCQWPKLLALVASCITTSIGSIIKMIIICISINHRKHTHTYTHTLVYNTVCRCTHLSFHEKTSCIGSIPTVDGNTYKGSIVAFSHWNIVVL